MLAAVRPLILVLALTACGAAKMQTLSIVNKTDRPIEALYVYPTGAVDHGASRGKLAPNASTQIQVKSGHVDVLALSAKLQLDEHTRDQPTASQSLEVTGPLEVIFYDTTAKPAGLERPGVIGVSFIITKPAPPPAPSE